MTIHDSWYMINSVFDVYWFFMGFYRVLFAMLLGVFIGNPMIEIVVYQQSNASGSWG